MVRLTDKVMGLIIVLIIAVSFAISALIVSELQKASVEITPTVCVEDSCCCCKTKYTEEA